MNFKNKNIITKRAHLGPNYDTSLKCLKIKSICMYHELSQPKEQTEMFYRDHI